MVRWGRKTYGSRSPRAAPPPAGSDPRQAAAAIPRGARTEIFPCATASPRRAGPRRSRTRRQGVGQDDAVISGHFGSKWSARLLTRGHARGRLCATEAFFPMRDIPRGLRRWREEVPRLGRAFHPTCSTDSGEARPPTGSLCRRPDRHAGRLVRCFSEASVTPRQLASCWTGTGSRRTRRACGRGRGPDPRGVSCRSSQGHAYMRLMARPRGEARPRASSDAQIAMAAGMMIAAPDRGARRPPGSRSRQPLSNGFFARAQE